MKITSTYLIFFSDCFSVGEYANIFKYYQFVVNVLQKYKTARLVGDLVMFQIKSTQQSHWPIERITEIYEKRMA